MTDGFEPIALAMIVCDAIHVDPGIGKRTLLGLFSAVYSTEFPATVPMLAVHVALTECRGALPVYLQIVDVNEERDPISRIDGTIEFDNPLATLEIDFRMGKVVFPEPGEYRVQFFAAETLIIERRILVVPPPDSAGEASDEPGEQ